MRFSLGGLLTTSGIVALLHTTYAVIQHREVLKLMQEEFESLPAALLLELAIGTVLSVLGAFMISGSLKVVVSSKQTSSMDVGGLRLDFMSFNTRARAFPLSDVQTS